jgi:hypothetical protein
MALPAFFISYLSCVETVPNVELREVPTELTPARITIEMPEAIKQYSIAVAPESSFRKAKSLSIRPHSTWPYQTTPFDLLIGDCQNAVKKIVKILTNLSMMMANRAESGRSHQ